MREVLSKTLCCFQMRSTYMRLLKILIYLQLKEFSFFEQFSLRRLLKDNFTR